MLTLILALLFSFCDKAEDNVNTDDPSDLSINVLSIDHETGFTQIQASAVNAVLYHLYIGNDEDPEVINETGYFEHTFEGQGDYEITVRAYGKSGRYVKRSQTISVDPGGETPEIPLDKGYFSPESYDGYSLVWQDEFNGNALNTTYWTHETGGGGWGNNELQYYRAENTSMNGGTLIIEARDDGYGGNDYTSSRMVTRNKFSFQYGRVDIRALLPKGQGLWPALWMLGQNFGSVGWPRCGEVDIMEMIGGNNRENTCYGTVHWDEAGEHASYGGSTSVSGDNLAEAYHVFSIIWDEARIRWYVDNQFFHEVTITDAEKSEFHQDFFLIFNVAVGGNWPGNPDGFTVFPQRMKVDYVRVFQQD